MPHDVEVVEKIRAEIRAETDRILAHREARQPLVSAGARNKLDWDHGGREEKMSKGMVEGEKIDVGFDGRRCIHSRNCVLGNPHVFEPNAPGEWIHPDAASAEQIVAIAESCPSGAITYRRKDGGPQEAPPVVNTVRIRENGPLAVHAEIVFNGETFHRATLCRCGASQNKPFCDGSHGKIGFAATGEPALKESQPLAARDGSLVLTPQPNGNLKLEGNVEIVTGTGHTVDRATKVWLCRCGHSATKPWCDGSHKKIGFVA